MAEAATPASCVSPELSAGNLDSRVLWVVADNPRVLHRLVEDLGGGFRKVWYDLAGEAGRAPVIYDLQAEDGPRARDVSSILPSVRAEQLPAAAHMLREIGGPLAFAEKRARHEPVAQGLLGVASGRSGAQVATQPDRPGSP